MLPGRAHTVIRVARQRHCLGIEIVDVEPVLLAPSMVAQYSLNLIVSLRLKPCW